MSKITESNPFYYGRPGGEQISGAPVVETKLNFDSNIVVRKTKLPASLPVLPVPVFPGPGELVMMESEEPFTSFDAEGSDGLDFIDEVPKKKGKK
jgi:hypothetical protein